MDGGYTPTKRRTRDLHIRVRPHEKERIRAAADKTGKYISEAVRAASLRWADEVLENGRENHG